MKRELNARIAGVSLLAYIAIGISQMVIGRGISSGDGMAARLASVAAHAPEVRIIALLGIVTSFLALTLGVTLYGLTRAEDEDLALLGLACRLCEGLLGTLPSMASLGLLWMSGRQLTTAETPAYYATADALVNLKALCPLLGATFFAVGSTLFSYLFLRARSISTVLAWLGVASSGLLVVLLPLQLVGVLTGSATGYMWLPMAVFEIALAWWLLVKMTPHSQRILHAQDAAVTR